MVWGGIAGLRGSLGGGHSRNKGWSKGDTAGIRGGLGGHSRNKGWSKGDTAGIRGGLGGTAGIRGSLGGAQRE